MNINKLQPRVLDRYKALSDEMQQAVRRAYERHRKACARHGVGADPNVIFELLSEAEAGRK